MITIGVMGLGFMGFGFRAYGLRVLDFGGRALALGFTIGFIIVEGIILGTPITVIKGETKSLDYSSYDYSRV